MQKNNIYVVNFSVFGFIIDGQILIHKWPTTSFSIFENGQSSNVYKIRKMHIFQKVNFITLSKKFSLHVKSIKSHYLIKVQDSMVIFTKQNQKPSTTGLVTLCTIKMKNIIIN